jgi:hypothetical protein
MISSSLPLAVVGRLDIPRRALGHRFVVEALAVARTREKEELERVVGTENTGLCELYGWAPFVAPHKDGYGFIYLACLNRGKTSIYARNPAGKIHKVSAPAGAVVRLDDRIEHWTEDSTSRVAAFVGHFPEPNDGDAIAALRSGITALASGQYYGAPRVRDGFRVLLDDECWATASLDDTLDTMLIDDARTAGHFIEGCALCDKPAVRRDPQWPHNFGMSRCMAHLQHPD